MNEIVIHPKYGPIEIIEDLGLDERSRRYVKIRFKNTGFTTITRYDIFKAGKVRDDYYGIDFNKLYDTNLYGPVKILKFTGRDIDHRVTVDVQFINSGAITNCQLRLLLKGAVQDPLYGINMNLLYPSNKSGPFKIIHVYGSNSTGHVIIRIKFILTGYEKDVQLQNALYGEVFDNTQHKCIPVDVNLIINPDAWFKHKLENIYDGIYNRCYNPNTTGYESYGKIGIRMSDSWKNSRDTFLTDVKNLFQYDKFILNPSLYHLDKDYLQQDIPINNRIYSKNTCVFLYYLDNENLRSIEYKRNNIDSSGSKYYGVYNDKGIWKTTIMINGETIPIGAFNDEIYAAAAFNYYQIKYHQYELIPLLNDIPYIPADEIFKYNRRPRKMVNILN